MSELIHRSDVQQMLEDIFTKLEDILSDLDTISVLEEIQSDAVTELNSRAFEMGGWE